MLWELKRKLKREVRSWVLKMPVPSDFFSDSSNGSFEQFDRICKEYRGSGNVQPPDKINPIVDYALEREHGAAIKLLKARFPNYKETPIDKRVISGLWDEMVTELYLHKK